MPASEALRDASAPPVATVAHPGLMGFFDLVEAAVGSVGLEPSAVMPVVMRVAEALGPSEPFDLDLLGDQLALAGLAADVSTDALLFIADRARGFPTRLDSARGLAARERAARVESFGRRYATSILLSPDASLPSLWSENTPVVSLDSMPTADPTRRTPTLTVMNGSELGAVFRVVKPFVVLGRSDTADVTLRAHGVSRSHAELELRGNDVVVRDMGARNGLFVNGLGVREHVLQDGDRMQVGEAILKFAWHDELEETFQSRLLRSLTEDPLTGVANRAYFTERLRAECAYCRRHWNPLAVLMVDVDHFKAVNDTWGHLAGDHVLAGIGELLKTAVRVEDLVGRYGGEEFAVLLRGATDEPARAVAERIRRTVADEIFLWKGERMDITISLGMASFDLDRCDTPAELIALADQRLYAAKRAGRNRVVA